MKEQLLQRLLGEAIGEDFLWEGLTASPRENAYRMKMEYSFGDAYRDGPLTLGMHKRGSHYDIVETDRCELVHEDLNLALRETLRFFRERKVPFLSQVAPRGLSSFFCSRAAAHTEKNSCSIWSRALSFPRKRRESCCVHGGNSCVPFRLRRA